MHAWVLLQRNSDPSLDVVHTVDRSAARLALFSPFHGH